MKKLFLILTILFIGLVAQASENYLQTIVLEGTDNGYNVILKADNVPKVRKQTKGHDTLILNVKGVATTDAVNAVYKNTDGINGLVVENLSKDEIKVYIQAKNIANSTIIAQTPNNNSVIIGERFPIEKLLWVVVVLFGLGFITKSAKKLTDYENSIVIKRDIKTREIELYRNFQKELASMPKINSKINNSYASSVMSKSERRHRELQRI